METGSKSKIELVLLGVWNILPVGTWTWFNDICVKQLELLTGKKLGVFYYIKDDLNYECFFKKDSDILKHDLDGFSPKEQLSYVKKITKDYFKEVVLLEKRLADAESLNVQVLNNQKLAAEIIKLAEAWSKVTMQIWYAVLLDIWYPNPKDKVSLKSIIANARDHCGHLHARSDKAEHVLYAEAAKRLRISEREIYFLIQPEIADALNNKGVMAQNVELASRMSLCVASNYKGMFEIYGGVEAEKFIKNFIIPAIGSKKESELKGTPACLGKVQGRAHVILLDKEFANFKDGEILVSLQTMVHYLPIMKKAKAILTEFGGLTSHAAIVSRELKKPCVVGINGLISSVKSGDLIEVDANKGLVRKIS